MTKSIILCLLRSANAIRWIAGLFILTVLLTACPARNQLDFAASGRPRIHRPWQSWNILFFPNYTRPAQKAQVLDSLKNFQSKMTAVVGGSFGPGAPAADAITLTRVNGQVAGLYGQIWQADAEPTSAQTEAAAALDHDASDAMQRWNNLKSSDLTQLNRALRSAKLPELQLESNPHPDETLMDEE